MILINLTFNITQPQSDAHWTKKILSKMLLYCPLPFSARTTSYLLIQPSIPTVEQNGSSNPRWTRNERIAVGALRSNWPTTGSEKKWERGKNHDIAWGDTSWWSAHIGSIIHPPHHCPSTTFYTSASIHWLRIYSHKIRITWVEFY